MTRLSDHLRGLAERAPVADSVISVEVASRRIARHRRMRAGANAAAGVGAATVIAFAAINPGAGGQNDAADVAAPAIADGAGSDSAATYEEGTRLAWGLCGSYPLQDSFEASNDHRLTLGQVPEDIKGGETLSVNATLVPAMSGEVETFGPQALILWNGMVVASGTSEVAESVVLSLTAGEPVEQSLSAELVDCWEGAALPGGTYQVLGVQELYTETEGEEPPPTDPVTEPDVPVEPSVAPEPAAPVGPDSAEPLPPDAAVEQSAAVSGLAADGATFTRVVSEPVDLVIAGDVPDGPFGQYLPKPVEPIDTPDDLLTTDKARAEFAAHVTSTPWAMEAGSQRVIKVNDSAEVSDQNAWKQNYFGCAWEDGQNVTFPSVSAEWDLLDVSATVPASIDVSYGWVVENNPEIDMSVTNVSGHTLPGYWGPDPNTSLVLVRDGKVVAEGYPVGALRDNRSPAESMGAMLSPGQSLEGTYLWREVNGCFDGTTQALVEPGTYTVLNSQSIYFDAGPLYYGQPIDGIEEPGVLYDSPAVEEGATSSSGSDGSSSASVGSGSARDAIAPAPLPAPGDGWLELQVWTSLGTVTVR